MRRLKSFRNSWGNLYIPCLSLIITFRFTCGESKSLEKHRKISTYHDQKCNNTSWFKAMWQCRKEFLKGTAQKMKFSIIDFFSKFFFSILVFFHEHSRFTGQQGKGEGLYHFHPLHRHLDISRAITAESSHLHIAGSR